MSNIVVLAPDLGVSADEFVSEWNADTTHPPTAQVVLEQTRIHAIPPGLIHGSIQVLGELGGAATIGAIVKLVERIAKRKGSHRKLQVIQSENPDGSKYLAITLEEE